LDRGLLRLEREHRAARRDETGAGGDDGRCTQVQPAHTVKMIRASGRTVERPAARSGPRTQQGRYPSRLSNDDSALKGRVGLEEMVVKAAGLWKVERQGVAALAGLQGANLVQLRTIAVDIHRVGHN